jgi:hypothetical protein
MHNSWQTSFCNFVGRKLLSCPTAKILMLLLRNLFWSRMLRFQTRNPNTVPEGGTATSHHPKCRTSLFNWLTPPHNGKHPKKIIPPKCQINATKSESPKQRHYTAQKKINTRFKSILITIFHVHLVTARGKCHYRLINANRISSFPTHNFGISQIFAHLARNKI